MSVTTASWRRPSLVPRWPSSSQAWRPRRTGRWPLLPQLVKVRHELTFLSARRPQLVKVGHELAFLSALYPQFVEPGSGPAPC